MKTRYTPDKVESLNENEILVFGSTLKGAHKGGVAKLALERFGATMGQGIGLQGRSYAIPSLQTDLSRIAPYVAKFIEFAKEHPNNIFIVTKIGCGRAGYQVSDIAPLFVDAYLMDNIVLPKEFCDIISPMLSREQIIVEPELKPEIQQESVSTVPNVGEATPIPQVIENKEDTILETPKLSEPKPNKIELPTLGLKVVGKIDISKYERKKTEIKANKKNIYIIDTNVFVNCPDIISKISNQYGIALSAKVVDELDKMKIKLDDEGKRNAQKALRMINTAMGKREIRSEYADPSLLPEDFDKKSPDNLILSVALKFKTDNPIVLTSDQGLQVKAKMMGLSTISLKEFLQY